MIDVKKDIKRILKISDRLKLNLDEESAARCWKQYSSIFGSKWLVLPDSKDSLEVSLGLYVKTRFIR